MKSVKPFTGEIYVHTNVLNGKSYVGQTTVGVSKRWALHQRCARSPKTPAYNGLIARAIRKYGANAFEHQILSKARSQSELDNLEKIWIILLQTKTPSGYNLADGGYAAAGHVVSPEVRARLSAKQKANWEDPDYRAAHSGAKAFHYRRSPSPETIEKRAAKMRGRSQSAEQIEHRAVKLRGKKRTDVFRARCAARMTGKKMSEETRLRMSLSQKARQSREGV